MAVNRLTGLTSGLDTDKLVQDLMKVERMKYDKVQKEKTFTEWQQEAYRTTIDMISGFQDKYFDLLTPETNMRSRSTFSAFSSEVRVDNEDVNYVTVAGTSGTKTLKHEISEISQLATKDTWHSSTTDISAITSGELTATELNEIKTDGIKFNLSIDGSTKEVNIAAGDLAAVSNVDDLIVKMNEGIQASFGDEYTNLVQKISVGAGEGVKIDVPGSVVKIYGADNSSSMSTFNFEEGESNTDYEDKTLASLYIINDSALDDFSINGKQIEGLSSTDTLEDFMAKINKSDAGVSISFNSIEDRFMLTSTKTGAVNNIDFSGSSDAVTLFGNMGFDTSGTTGGDGSGGAAYRVEAENAVFVLDGQTIVKEENNFKIDGIEYTLNEVYNGVDPIKVKLESDTDALVEKITNFVNDYNDLIKKLNLLVSERRSRDYEPLTDEEKKSLSDDQIEQWETQAKKGVLSRESNITQMLDNMRSALYDSVEGVDITLTEIGITTSDNYKDKGKLVIDEEKLKTALEDDYQSVVSLFTADSDKLYLDSENSKERYKESGIAERFNDILNDAVRTNRDENGNKGNLLEKAGMVDDASEDDNVLTKELKEYDRRLEYLLDFLAQKETSYYNMFARMEASLSQLSQQSASLAQQFGG